MEEADWESRSSVRFRRFAWTSGRACAWNSDENARARLWKDCHLYSVSDFYNPRQPSLRALRKLHAVWLLSICLVEPVCLYLWSWLHLNGPFSAREVGRLSRSSQDDQRPANGMPEKTVENAWTSVHVRTTHATRSSTAQRGRIETVSDELQMHWEQLLETEQFHEQAHKLAWIRQRIERYVWRVSFGKGVKLIKKTKKGKNCYNPRVCTFSWLQQNVCQVIKKISFQKKKKKKESKSCIVRKIFCPKITTNNRTSRWNSPKKSMFAWDVLCVVIILQCVPQIMESLLRQFSRKHLEHFSNLAYLFRYHNEYCNCRNFRTRKNFVL